MADKRKYKMSRSVLQEEAGNSFLMKMILLFLAAVAIMFLIWSTRIELNEVVSTEGEVESIESISKIQHPTGGKITEILVKERQTVRIGDPLLKLDDTIISLQIEEEQLNINNLVKQRNLLNRELDVQKELYDQKLTVISEYLSLERRVADVIGQIQIGLKKIERYSVLQERTIIYASRNGTVHGLSGYSSGSVIRPGETVFTIVPDEISYSAKIRIPVSRIGSVKEGQMIMLKFSSYNYSIFGGMEAVLDEISATTFTDNNNKAYYQGVVMIPRNYLTDGKSRLPILQGMTLNGEIRIGIKTLFQYLFLPVKASGSSAFKEP